MKKCIELLSLVSATLMTTCVFGAPSLNGSAIRLLLTTVGTTTSTPSVENWTVTGTSGIGPVLRGNVPMGSIPLVNGIFKEYYFKLGGVGMQKANGTITVSYTASEPPYKPVNITGTVPVQNGAISSVLVSCATVGDSRWCTSVNATVGSRQQWIAITDFHL